MNKIAILGACVSRDAFNHNFIKSWRNEFDVVLYRFQPSIISLMSCPIPYNRDLLFPYINLSDKGEMLLAELGKHTLNDLLSVNPTIILLDFYSDVQNGVLQAGNYGYITNRFNDWKDIPAFCALRPMKKMNIQEKYECYLELWKKSFDRFMLFLEKCLPETLIVVNCVRASNVIKYSNGMIKTHRFKDAPDIELLNKAWREMDEYACKQYNICSCTYEKDYFIDPDYIWGGAWIVHYHKDYYIDFYNKLLEISNSRRLKENNTGAYNLIFNGDLSLHTLYYRIWNENFTVKMEEEDLVVHFKNDDVNKMYSQIWSDEVETSGLRWKNCYTVAFDCRILDINIMAEDKVIFCVRTFQKRGLFKRKDCKEEYKIKVSPEHLLYGSKKFFHYEISFQTVSKFFSVGMVVAGCGEIEWKNICVSHKSMSYQNSIAERFLISSDDYLIDVNSESIVNMRQIERLKRRNYNA